MLAHPCPADWRCDLWDLLLPPAANSYNVFLTPHKRIPRPVMSDFFNEAYRRARSQFTAEQWLALPPQQVTEAIYQAMRALDAANAGQLPTRSRAKSKVTRSDERPEP